MKRVRLFLLGVLTAGVCATVAAVGELPAWIRNVEANSAIEAAFFRMMPLSKGAVAFRRPPRETRPALGDLIKTQPHNAELYSLRALEDEQQLDVTAAESDWKAYVENSSDKSNAQLALADFYHHRLRPVDEIKTLSLVASAPPIAAEKLTAASQQRSWQAFERIFGVIQAQGLPKESSIAQYRSWIARYPDQQSLYARFLEFLVEQKEYSAAGQLITDYRKQFPDDQIFPVKAKAMVEYRRGSVREGLSVYEQNFQPLWDPQLVKSYFDLLRDTQSLRKFRDDAHAALLANPQDLNATARLFYYYQQQGKADVAQQAITDYRLHKEANKAQWTSLELYICARLLEDVHSYPESARYYFALYNSKDLPTAQETAIAGLTSILLTAPETPIRLGSGELSMYRDIATLDQGPGYLNGILSLILNTTEPASQYSQEEQRSVPYFHRSRAAELLALLDSRFPNAVRRAELHAQLLEFYANAGESDAVIQGGREFLAGFPKASQRTQVALLMADAYARKDDTTDEFAIYDSVLQELAARVQNVPLGTADGTYSTNGFYSPRSTYETQNASETEGEEGIDDQSDTGTTGHRARASQSFQLGAPSSPERQTGARSPEYARVLERYLSRLVQMKQIPPALAVLRHEIDRNPDDPGLYERLATFLDQNKLGSQQEEVYRLAMARFPDKSWYDKLARFYLRHKRDSEFEQLMRDAIAAFKGSELEQHFNDVLGGGPVMYLRLNLYAHQRFPHNPVFVRNLLGAYQSPKTYDQAAWEALLRQHWFEDVNLRNRFFQFLSSSHKLDAELAAIREIAPDAASWEKNPAAADFLANANLWRSHFEESAPVLMSLAAQYPAESEIAGTASSVYRSLAYFEPADTAIAAKIEDNLLQANPGDAETMARIGDIYADREQFALAAPYWERIPQVSPGQAAGYLEAATIYWDYFDFESALRLLATGRERVGNPSLYSYEEGAIYENQRDYPHAIDEYVKGALSASESSAEMRLLQLARRSKFRDLVDRSTAKIVALPNPSMPAVYLRVKVLEAQNRKPEIEGFLDGLAQGTASIEQAEEIETLAQQKSLETVRQHAIEKQAALTTDPVTRLQLRYALIQLYEGRKDFASAQKNVEALYRENPKILGVVRSTVDFYWRVKLRPQAIAVLLQAAKDAYPALGSQFTYEAARKSTDAKQFQQARDLLAGLLKDSPYNGEYLAAMADTYAQAGDDRGLEQFYVEKIAMFRNAPLPAETRKAQTATLRRGLIPALTRMNNYSGAIDQYIELINNFPEDEALVTQSALYALRYQRQQQLVDFYARTVTQSPKDYRWSMVLARTYTNLENYPAAIDIYGKSIAIRPDRADLYTARAELEERLMRFDEAAVDYEHIYQLAYKDPQWMEKVAAVRARQGKVQDVVAALQTALITGRPGNASNYFEAARRLESWGMLDQARSFAEYGVATAGADLLASADNHAGAKTYVRILTRLRQQQQAYATLQKAVEDSKAALPVLKEQVQRQGVTGLTDAQWRENVRRTRIETARTGMESAVQEMGSVVNTYFTPEERMAFGTFAESKHNGMPLDDVEKFAIPLAVSAALADQEARWRFDEIMQRVRSQDARANYYPNTQPFVDLQRRRGRFAELGSQMEQFAAVLRADMRNAPLIAAADAYHSAGDEQNEMRVLGTVFPSLDSNHQERYFELLLEKQPNELIRLASTWTAPVGWGEQAADFAVAHGSPAIAQAVVQARSKPRPLVWEKAYSALVGLYYSEHSPQVNSAFLSALGDDPISARLAKPVDRDQQLAGNTWFYYGSRYGEYLGTAKLGNPEDFLPAILEQSPASASGYMTLADYYAGSGDTKRAIDDYTHTLELSPDRADVYDSLAVAYYKQGDRAAALAQWKLAFAVLSKQLDRGRVPDSFWRDFGRTCDELRARHAFAELKPDADAVVRTYLHVNGNWLSNALLHPAYAAQGDPVAATAWLLDMSASAQDPAQVLGDVADASWIPLVQRARVYQRVLELKENAVGKSDGIARQSAQQELGVWQERWIRYLVLSTKQYPEAATAIAALPKDTRDALQRSLVPLELQAAAHLGTLDAILAAYHAEPQIAPAAEILRTAARKLFEDGDKQSARKILELVFAREIEDHKLVAANFLGLAEIRLAAGDSTGALDLLRRLVVAVGAPFENLDLAAALLEKTGHNAEAVEFLDQLVKSAPWDASYRLRLAKAKLTPGSDVTAQDALSAIASAPNASYDLRLKAAAALTGRTHSELGSAELNLLASGKAALTPATADKFYFHEARIRAAENSVDNQTKIQLLSHCAIDFPRRETARIPLFEAAANAHSYAYALGILEPLFQTQFLRNDVAEAGSEEEQIVSSGEEDIGESGEEAGISVSSETQLSRAQRVRVSQLIGDAMTRLGRYPDALSYYQTAHSLETAAAARKALNRKIADTKSVLRIQRANAARQPLLHEALEQDRLVRPRLLARITPASAATTKGGAKP
ncbi:MAG TPA: BTAD domain-containing putative transcriptional regulator [Candidatus Dormibacteraeota bacterium]|nr:BTAD domain-containing putative transcriptional regulator [Candidatus Dormibacteraeota bacterium]